MKRVQKTIMAMGGHQGRECYQLSYMAVDEAVKQQSEMPRMKESDWQ